jgi:hypothetical protein
MRYAILALLLLAAGGCNLFSPFHDEGKSDDLDDIIGDVQAALERGEPDRAYQYAADGIEKFPSSVALHYLGAVARVQVADIGFADFASMLRSADEDDGEPYSLLPLYRGAAADTDTVFFLDLSQEDLERIAGGFNTSYQLLHRALELIADGDATKEEIEDLGSDIQLGFGISALLKAMLTVIDQDHELGTGFQLDPSIKVYETEEGWGFRVGADPGVICPAMDYLLEAEQAIYQHYRSVADPGAPADIFAECPTCADQLTDYWPAEYMIDDGALAGEFLANVHNGIVNFRAQHTCPGE